MRHTYKTCEIDMKKTIKHEFRDLEMRVFCILREKITKSKHQSKFVNEKCLKVNVFDYVELTIINDRLTFIDSGGYHFSIYSDCSLEDLIDIIESVK
jgi:hypothetical protein